MLARFSNEKELKKKTWKSNLIRANVRELLEWNERLSMTKVEDRSVRNLDGKPAHTRKARNQIESNAFRPHYC